MKYQSGGVRCSSPVERFLQENLSRQGIHPLVTLAGVQTRCAQPSVGFVAGEALIDGFDRQIDNGR
jgi:hypothetical protein